MKQKICRKCEKPRLRSGTLCYTHYLEHKRELREALQARKLARRATKKAKTVQRSALSKKNLDNLWKKATKDYYGHRCMKCGSTNYLNSHHIIGRSNFGVRWDYRNCAVLCSDCHMFNRQFSAHVHPGLFHEWIIEKKGKDWYLDLLVRARNLKPDRNVYLEELKNLTNEKTN